MDVLAVTLSGLSIARRCRAAEAVYLLDLSLQVSSAALVAASCSDYKVRLHHRETLSMLGELGGHSSPLCGVAFAHASADLLYSGSADGTLRAWDVRSRSSVQTFSSEPTHSYCSFDLNCDDMLLCAGTEQEDGEDSFLVFWDTRKPSATLGVYSESHSDDITQVRFHPSDKDRLASGSMDGLVNVFDLSRGSEDDALLATCNNDSSVSHVRWSGHGHAHLLCLSHNHGVHLWDLRRLDSDQPLALFSATDARGLANVDYLVGAQWVEEERRLMVVGGWGEGHLRLMECDGDGLRLIRSLSGGHTSTVRCFLWDTDDIFTGGEDGQLLLWKQQGGEEPIINKREPSKSQSALRLKTRLHKKHGLQREKKKC
ncbi:WD repeat-containing protein 89 [Gouania willdenowi]|nr:WD repeat-containing protein 89 [Gouania willdenowi]